MVNDYRGQGGEPRAERPTTPDEVEAVEEFETVPQVASGDPDPAPGAAPERAQPTSPPSAVESFDRAPPPPSPAVTPAPPAPVPAAPQVAPPTSPAPVPGPPLTAESTRCPRCGTENRPGIAFCRNCGQRLVAASAATVARPGAPEGMQTCPRCGTVNRLGIAFCQNCGAGLRGPAEHAAQPVSAPSAYVPPAVSVARGPTARRAPAERAVLGPIVLIIGAIGLGVGWALPFEYRGASLLAGAVGPNGYGVAFWNAYDEVGGALADQAYFGFAAPVPALIALLVLLAIGGVVRARPRWVQVIGLLLALVWALGLGGLFFVVEVVAAEPGPFTALLRSLSAAGIIFFLSSIVVAIGVLTRFARS